MIREDFNVNGHAGVDVHIQSGRVEIKGGETGVIAVEVDTPDPGFVVEQRGNTIHLFSDKTSSWLSRGSTYVVIAVPEGSDASIGTASGKIETRVTLGEVEAKTASGKVNIAAANDLTVKTASGSTSIGVVTGDLRISSASGDADIGEVHGKCIGSSASGDLHIGESTGDVTASTASGDIAVTKYSGDRAVFKSMSGSIQVGIAAGTSLELDANLLSGELNLPTPTPSDETREIERHMTIKAKLVSGNLTILRA